MRLPHFRSRKKFEKLDKQNEEVFAEASELALLRLERCFADQRIPGPTMKVAVRPPHGLQPLRKFTDPL
jgi:hypothetical protein